MKFMIAGLGSIGRRHLRNLVALGEEDILLYRSGKSTLPDDELKGYLTEMDLDSALAHEPDADQCEGVLARVARHHRDVNHSTTIPCPWGHSKVLAPVRAGITTVMLPERNRKDFEDIPLSARDAVHFVWLSTVDDAIAAALEPVPTKEALDPSDNQRRTASGQNDADENEKSRRPKCQKIRKRLPLVPLEHRSHSHIPFSGQKCARPASRTLTKIKLLIDRPATHHPAMCLAPQPRSPLWRRSGQDNPRSTPALCDLTSSRHHDPV